jgi:AcrR family transcriptional regulator
MTYVKSEITINNILSAAGSLFIERNYADVTMEEIAERCSMTKGALYYHFSSKEELYMEMMLSFLTDLRDLLNNAIDSPGDSRTRLRYLTEAFFDLPYDQRELIQLVRRDINIFNEPSRTKLIKAYQSSLPEIIEEVIIAGIKSGEIRKHDSRLLSWQFVAIVEVILSPYSSSFFKATKHKLDYVLDNFFHGAGTSENGGKR